MIKLKFPKDRVSVKQREGINEIFDVIRKKWLRLSPEEWVRQNMIQLLISKNYPDSLLSIEKEIKQGELKRRCDIVVYTRDMKPFMIIECKEMDVTLNEKTMAQILRYHITLQVKYLIITNGSYCFGFEKRDDKFFEINEFPAYKI
ncbi:MAG: type I restriction enzyme HsdR N-terminal domain-containing protein [Bacteroidota bacterium]|nr:type I restriction enzyme HsdR N-terminal domain-containing protein [Bacteroidota bacterium]